jgi:lysophospholipase L1-like esterase
VSTTSKTGRRLGLGLATAAVGLLLLEGLLRLIIPEQSLLLSWEREDGLLLYRSRTYVEGPAEAGARDAWRRGELSTRPNATTQHMDGPHAWAVQTNEEGLREVHPVDESKATDRRFLALGDSWMFGVSADQGQTLPDQLERLLPAKLGVERVEVLNAGIPGANAWHMLRRWNHLRDRIDIDGVLIGLPHNAPDADVHALRNAWYRDARGAPHLNSWIYLGLRRLVLPLSRQRYPDLLNHSGDSGDLQYRMTIADLKILADDVRAQGIPAWLVLWPNDWAAAHTGAVDLSQWTAPLEGLPMAGHALDERQCWGHVDTWHPSEAGYMAIAQVIAQLMAGGPSSGTLTGQPQCVDGL